MFKLVVLSALLVIVPAHPSLYDVPLVYEDPVAHTTIVQEPVLAKVGSVVKSVPTAVSHQSQSVVHSSAHVIEDVVAPVVKSTSVINYAAPVVAHVTHSSYAASAPVVHTSYAGTPVLKTIGNPLIYNAGW